MITFLSRKLPRSGRNASKISKKASISGKAEIPREVSQVYSPDLMKRNRNTTKRAKKASPEGEMPFYLTIFLTQTPDLTKK